MTGNIQITELEWRSGAPSDTTSSAPQSYKCAATNHIDVTGIDGYVLLAALHNHTTTPDTFFCKRQSLGRDISPEEAKKGASESLVSLTRGGVPIFPDYLYGRPIKAFLSKEGERVLLKRADLYNRDAKKGMAEFVVSSLRSKGG